MNRRERDFLYRAALYRIVADRATAATQQEQNRARLIAASAVLLNDPKYVPPVTPKKKYIYSEYPLDSKPLFWREGEPPPRTIFTPYMLEFLSKLTADFKLGLPEPK